MTYTDVITRQNQRRRADLQKKIELATKLGFHDDVIHWTNELNKLEEGEN